MKKTTKASKIMEGLDDIAHNRMWHSKNGKLVKVDNYGLRNVKEKCYCKELKKSNPAGER